MIEGYFLFAIALAFIFVMAIRKAYFVGRRDGIRIGHPIPFITPRLDVEMTKRRESR